MDAVEMEGFFLLTARGNQGRAGQGRGSFLKDMGCMLWEAGDAGEGGGQTYILLRKNYDATGTGRGVWNAKEQRKKKEEGIE